MTTYAFTFGEMYDLHDAIVLVDAPTQTEAIAEFMRVRRQLTDGERDAQYRYETVGPYDGTFRAILEFQQYRVVPIDTPIHFRHRSRGLS